MMKPIQPMMSVSPGLCKPYAHDLFALCAAAILALGSPVSFGQGISTEGPFTVVRSDTNDTLLSFNLELNAPPPDIGSVLSFDFGFGTDEPVSPGTFYDSFSATLQNSNQTATALLFTSDRSGTQWAPPNPGGLTVNPSNVFWHVISFPQIGPAKTTQFAYIVNFLLPPELTGLVTLFFDFFDNLNQFSSLAFVSNVQLLPLAPPWPALQSSPYPGGPFVDEAGVVNDTTNKLLRLPFGGRARFFRVRSDLVARITRFQVQDQQFLFGYAFQPTTIVLQSAATQAGPYTTEANALLDTNAQTFALAPPQNTRVYRVQSNPPATISRQELAGGQLILHYEFAPQFVVLQFSPAVTGPFVDAAGMANDLLTRQITLPRYIDARFFRLRSDQTNQITGINISGRDLIIHYQ